MSAPAPLAVPPRQTPWWRAQRDILARWTADALEGAPAGALLKTDLFDEASGPFHHADRLPSGLRFVGVDRDAGVVAAARRRLGGRARTGCIASDVRHLALAGDSISAVLSLSTLDHFDATADIAASLADLYRVLVPGGRLLLTLDNPLNAEVALRSRLPGPVLRRLRADAFPLGRTLGPRAGRRLLEQVGFEVERCDSLVHSPRYPAIRFPAWLERVAAPWARRAERMVVAAEWFGRLPTRHLTGHYVAWIARKPASPRASSAPMPALPPGPTGPAAG